MSSNGYTVGQVYEVDPATLTIGTNVRVDVRAQRRTVTATKVGTPSGTVPVRVVERPEDAERIVAQISENVHRAAMREAEERDAIEQLALLGVSAAQIAKRTAIKREQVDAALTVVQSPTAKERMDTAGLTLTQAAALAEFEDDPDAVAVLEREIEWGRDIEHAAQRLRDARAEREELRAEAQRLRDEGIPALDPEEHPSSLWQYDLRSLVRASDGKAVPEEEWADLPGAAVVLEKQWQTVEAEDQDADTDPQDADAKRAERRRVVENNKAWRSAETVRREWLTGFVTRKTAPKGAEEFICAAVIEAPHWLGQALDDRHAFLRGLLCGEQARPDYTEEGRQQVQALHTTQDTTKAQTMRTLAAVLAAWEARTDVHTWRSPNAWDRRVVAALTQWGYSPSEVEQLLLAEQPAAA